MNRFLYYYYLNIKPAFLQKPLYNPTSESPFFILSSGRSGSTLLRRLLLANTDVNIPPESGDFLTKLGKFYLRNNHKPWEYIVEGCIDIFNEDPSTEFWKAELKTENFNELVNPLFKDKSLAGIIFYFYKHYALIHSLPSISWGDKTPFLIYRLPWLNLLYPSAKFIFLIRDGRAVVNSFLKLEKGYDIETAILRWKKSIKFMNKQLRKIPAARMLIIRYEDLVTNPQQEIKRVAKFLVLEINNNSKEEIFMGDDSLVHHKNIHTEISQMHIDKWKKELTGDQISWITGRLEKELKNLHYDF